MKIADSVLLSLFMRDNEMSNISQQSPNKIKCNGSRLVIFSIIKVWSKQDDTWVNLQQRL